MERQYNNSQDELYEGCDLLATSLLEDLADFTAFKPKYTTTFVDEFKDLINEARNLPDDAARSAQHEVLRTELKEITEGACYKAVNSLRAYIRDAFPKSVYDTRLNEAGFGNYEKAFNLNWEKLRALMLAGNNFISNHSVALLANDNMPATFPATFTALKTNIDNRVTGMLNTRENTKQDTSEKVNANNIVYTAAMSICADGQVVFIDNEDKKSQFIWEHIMTIVSPPGAAGWKVTVKEAMTNIPLPGARVWLQQIGEVAEEKFTDAEGKVFFEDLSAGDYNANISLDGYQGDSGSFRIKPGVIHRSNVTLQKNI